MSGAFSMILQPRAKQLRDVYKSGGNQPTNISLINRSAKMVLVSANAMILGRISTHSDSE